eukprot:1156351-Pelagomonas_calceolata.AAC.12
MVMTFVLTGAVPGARGGRAERVKTKAFETFAPKFCPLHPRSPKLGCPGKKLCWASMLCFKADERLAGSERVAKVPGQGVHWVRQGGRCELYRETGKFKDSHS